MTETIARRHLLSSVMGTCLSQAFTFSQEKRAAAGSCWMSTTYFWPWCCPFLFPTFALLAAFGCQSEQAELHWQHFFFVATLEITSHPLVLLSHYRKALAGAAVFCLWTELAKFVLFFQGPLERISNLFCCRVSFYVSYCWFSLIWRFLVGILRLFQKLISLYLKIYRYILVLIIYFAKVANECTLLLLLSA